MPTQQIEWADGSGDKIYITSPDFSGNQQIAVSSDPNTGAARSKVVTFSAGNVLKTLTVEQAAGTIPYLTNGLVFWLDGIYKGTGGTDWVEILNGHRFVNHGATFNSNNIYLDGSSYLLSTTGASIPTSSGTIEVVYEKEADGIIYMPNNGGSFLAFGWGSSGLYWGANSTKRRVYTNAPSKGSVSINVSRGLANGVAMSYSGTNYFSGGKANEFYIGKRNYATPNYFKGKVFAVRIYNRELTKNEILQNLAVDNIRFNLGLTL